MGVVLDTSAVIELERRGAGLFDALGSLANEKVVLPAIVYAELLVGVRLADSVQRADARRARIVSIADRVPIVEFDASVAERWADLFADTSKRGKVLPSNDLAIAATALHLDFDVLVASRGEAHYDDVPGLRVRRLPR